MIRFGAWSIILLLGAVQGVFVSACLLAKPVNRAANLFLSALIFLLSLKLTPYIIGYAGFYMVYPWLDLAPFDLSLGFGPLLYLYVVRLTQDTLPPRWWAHLVPLATQLLVYGILFSMPLPEKQHFEDTVGPAFNTAENLLECLSFFAYLALTWRQIKLHELVLAERFSNPELHRLKPLRLNLAVITVTLLAFAGAKLWTILAWRLSYYQMFPFYLLLTAAVYIHGFFAFQFAQVQFSRPPPAPEPKETDWRALATQYSAQLDQGTFWRDPFLSLSTASKALDTTEARLSKALNLGLEVSFSVWINSYRIEKVVQHLAQEGSTETVMDVAQRCGFNSKATFNRWFRAVKGCTPTEFRSARSTVSPVPEPRPAQPQYPPL